MTLGRRHLFTSIAFALPAALLVFLVVSWMDEHERIVALEKVAVAHVSSIMRDACEQDPQWFLAGPRTPRPRMDERQQPDADVNLPRPRADQLPFEMFAFDEEYSPKSVAGPRFPDDFKKAMRASTTVKQVSGNYDSNAGTGIQTAIATGWTPGPCAVLLFRQQPGSSRSSKQAGLFFGLFALFSLVAFATTLPTARRVRKLSLAARQSAKNDYTEIVQVSGSDEVGSFSSLFNDIAAELRRKTTDARDREDVLRRYVEHSSLEVGEPLAALELQLGRLNAARPDSETAAVVKEAHRVLGQVKNQAAVIRLRGGTDEAADTVDLAAVVKALVASRAVLATAAQVTIDASKANEPATVKGDRILIEQAIANVLDNAIIYNRPGGLVRITLHAYDRGQRFKLLIGDNGPGVSDEDFEGLTANKRFRGDESRTRRPGGRGLGLAVAREVADRFGMQLDLRRPSTGGLEAEFATRS